ncbi:MAG: hypothetical protein CVU44_02435 [Chloroflexi bacterium HGW-Chloroflexi-6]|nr:MAG: hypothetical protein CVU44_02435 [Chloroflexi bacterium HGW-Chloroflexi-6]
MADKIAFGSPGCGYLIIGGLGAGLCLALILLLSFFGMNFAWETVGAGDAVAVQVEQTVVARQTADALAAQQTQAAVEQQALGTALAVQLTQLAAPQDAADQDAAAAPDAVDPNSGIQPIAPVADPNSGEPQVSIRLQANVRNGPGITCKAVSALLKDSVVPVLAKNKDGSWLLIRLPDGTNGWVAASVTNAAGVDISSFSVASNPPVCPPPATATLTPTPTSAAAATATSTPKTAGPTQLEKTSWQVDFAFSGGSDRLQVTFTQNGSVLSGSNRDNNAELDIITNGTVTGNTVVITFTLSNAGSPRGSITCIGTISGSPQTISGTFSSTEANGSVGPSGSCTFR